MGLIQENSCSSLAEPGAGATHDLDILFCLHRQDHSHQLLGAERTLGSLSAPRAVHTAAVEFHRAFVFNPAICKLNG